MRALRRFIAELFLVRREEFRRLLSMTGLLYLVVTTVGMLRPIKNAFALDGLADSEFYKVYAVSAVVVLVVPLYNFLADRFPWRWLISGVAFFFATNFIIFRVLYREGSAAFGIIFYGWADLFSAVMVTQLFIAAQLLFNSRDAKRLYPMVIAGASLGAVTGGAITGFLAQRVGTPNLLLIGAGLVLLFAVTVPFVWKATERPTRPDRRKRKDKLSAGDLRTILADPHVRLIAFAVLLAVVVKQLLDYQFNTITKESFESLNAVSAFQGKFNAATQWLPLVALVGLRPAFRRWGVGIVFVVLPVFMLGANLGLALFWGLGAAVVAKAGEASLRYTTDRTSREILFIPVADDIKLKAKAYIDIAVETGIGKVLSAGILFVCISLIDFRRVGLVAAGLAVVWLVVALGVRREYVRTLVQAIQGRFASLEGVFATIADASTLPVVRSALVSGDKRQTAFALDLLDQIDAASVRPLSEDLHSLLDHPEPDIRTRALTNLALHPEVMDEPRVRARVSDPDGAVREAAVAALYSARSADWGATMAQLLASDDVAVRTAALSWVAEEEIGAGGLGMIGPEYIEDRIEAARGGDSEARLEVGLAAASLQDDRRVDELLAPLLEDPDPVVAAAAIRSAGILGSRELLPGIVGALGRAPVREAAREALERQGGRVVGTLSDYLLDPDVPLTVRRAIPGVLAGIAEQSAVDALVRCIRWPECDLLVYRRALRALDRLIQREPDLSLEWAAILPVLEGEVARARGLATARTRLDGTGVGTPAARLLLQAVEEGWEDARARVVDLLVLRYPPREMRRALLTLEKGSPAAAANAVELVEQLVDHDLFRLIEPALVNEPVRHRTGPGLRETLEQLAAGRDPWIAACAGQVLADDNEGRAAEGAPLERTPADSVGSSDLRGRNMNLIEKVFLLQRVDLLEDARSSDLALLASIAEEVSVEKGSVLLREAEPADALYVVTRGQVELKRSGETVLEAGEGIPFGTWSLIDDSPSLIEATATEPTQLLCIGRDDFYDLLADHPELVRGLLQGLARRVRNLVA